jgi:uncharacterized protein (DUF433 family)
MENVVNCRGNICGGSPTLDGRRLTVYDIVTKIYYEETLEIALEDYEITLEEASAVTEYCLNLNCKNDLKRKQFCNGCILAAIDEGWTFDKSNYEQINDKLTVLKAGGLIFLGTIQELEDEQFGRPGWLIAEEIYPKLKLE